MGRLAPLLSIVAIVLLLQVVPPVRIASAQDMIPAVGGSLTLPAIGDRVCAGNDRER